MRKLKNEEGGSPESTLVIPTETGSFRESPIIVLEFLQFMQLFSREYIGVGNIISHQGQDYFVVDVFVGDEASDIWTEPLSDPLWYRLQVSPLSE